MFKRQTKDKQRIDELTQKNHEQFMEINRLQQTILDLLDKIDELNFKPEENYVNYPLNKNREE